MVFKIIQLKTVGIKCNKSIFYSPIASFWNLDEGQPNVFVTPRYERIQFWYIMFQCILLDFFFVQYILFWIDYLFSCSINLHIIHKIMYLFNKYITFFYRIFIKSYTVFQFVFFFFFYCTIHLKLVYDPTHILFKHDYWYFSLHILFLVID